MKTQDTGGRRRRTVEEFPKMKDRAGRRRYRRERRALVRRLPSLLDVLGRAVRALVDGFSAIGRAAVAAADAGRQMLGAFADVMLDGLRRYREWQARPFPDGGAWVLRALPAGATS